MNCSPTWACIHSLSLQLKVYWVFFAYLYLTLLFFTGSRQGLSGGTGDIICTTSSSSVNRSVFPVLGVVYSVFSSNWSFFFDFGVFLDDTDLAGVLGVRLTGVYGGSIFPISSESGAGKLLHCHNHFDVVSSFLISCHFVLDFIWIASWDWRPLVCFQCHHQCTF